MGRPVAVRGFQCVADLTGVASLEDKIVQQALVWVLESIFEEDFLGFSYGFRPGRGQHQALDALYMALTSRKVGWVLDADIRGFFDHLDHEWLMQFISHRVSDRRVLASPATRLSLASAIRPLRVRTSAAIWLSCPSRIEPLRLLIGPSMVELSPTWIEALRVCKPSVWVLPSGRSMRSLAKAVPEQAIKVMAARRPEILIECFISAVPVQLLVRFGSLLERKQGRDASARGHDWPVGAIGASVPTAGVRTTPDMVRRPRRADLPPPMPVL